MFAKKYLATFLWGGILLIAASAALAGPYDIKETTPEIQRAISNRQNRYDQLASFKAAGKIGESKRGYVEVVHNASEAKALVQAENADRKVIYQAIVTQNNLGPSGLAKVEGVFAEVQREKAKRGDYIQTASGSWVQK